MIQEKKIKLHSLDSPSILNFFLLYISFGDPLSKTVLPGLSQYINILFALPLLSSFVLQGALREQYVSEFSFLGVSLERYVCRGTQKLSNFCFQIFINTAKQNFYYIIKMKNI